MFYYLIALQNYKYYVMLSDDDNISIDTLPSHNICDWLLINRPLRIEKVIKYDKKCSINDHVIYFMQQYGQGNVRGGTFINVILSNDEKQILDVAQYNRHFKLIDNYVTGCCCFSKPVEQHEPLLVEINQ